jgi:hypothetical protein
MLKHACDLVGRHPRNPPKPQGRPIYIQLLGKIDIGTLKKITTEERMVKFHIQVRPAWAGVPADGRLEPAHAADGTKKPAAYAEAASGGEPSPWCRRLAQAAHALKDHACGAAPSFTQEYERCGKFIFPVCSRIAGRQIDQTFGIMDVKGVGMSHLTGEVKRLVSMLTKYDQVRRPGTAEYGVGEWRLPDAATRGGDTYDGRGWREQRGLRCLGGNPQPLAYGGAGPRPGDALMPSCPLLPRTTTRRCLAASASSMPPWCSRRSGRSSSPCSTPGP